MKTSVYRGILITSIVLALVGLIISLVASIEKIQYLVTVGVSIMFAFVVVFGGVFIVGNRT